MEIIPEAFSPLYPWAFIIVINSLDSPDNMLANNALYPWGTSVGKDTHRLSIGSAKFKHERMQSCSISQSSNYIRSGFLSNLLCCGPAVVETMWLLWIILACRLLWTNSANSVHFNSKLCVCISGYPTLRTRNGMYHMLVIPYTPHCCC